MTDLGKVSTDLARATPRPWRVNHDSRWSIAEIVAANGIRVAQRVHPIDAALIVAAANAYDPTQADTAALDTLSQLSAQHDERMAVLRAELDELIAVLREYALSRVEVLQYGGILDAKARTCKICNSEWKRIGAREYEPEWHTPECILGRALAKADGTEPSPGGAT